MKQKKEDELNCIVINGKRHVLREADLNGVTICKQCSLHDICDDTIEYPICELLHSALGNYVYKLLEDGNKSIS